jgi:hypothetical protein
MANDYPKEALAALEALRAVQALHATHRDAGSLRTRFAMVGPDRKPDEAAAPSSIRVSALTPNY